MLSNKYIKESAIEVGFDLVGVTQPRDFDENRIHFEKWVASGAADSLDYMSKYMDVRFNPAMLLEGTRTVVVCALNYKNQFSIDQPLEGDAKIASYALATDYHKVIRRQLKALSRKLQECEPSLSARCCVDTAPLLEKQLAHEAGLGWIGRQSLLITPQFGSYVVLGVLLLTAEVDQIDSPYSGATCGSCRRCIEQCPNSAIGEERTIDSRLCISAQTVECDNTQGVELHGWLFGCDECQRCCPHNAHTPLATSSSISPIAAPLSSQGWSEMRSEEFAAKFGNSPLKRAGLERLQKNAKR